MSNLGSTLSLSFQFPLDAFAISFCWSGGDLLFFWNLIRFPFFVRNYQYIYKKFHWADTSIWRFQCSISVFTSVYYRLLFFFLYFWFFFGSTLWVVLRSVVFLLSLFSFSFFLSGRFSYWFLILYMFFYLIACFRNRYVPIHLDCIFSMSQSSVRRVVVLGTYHPFFPVFSFSFPFFILLFIFGHFSY